MKYKIVSLLNIIFIIAYAIIDLILGFYFHFDVRFFYSTIFFLMGTSITFLIFIILKLVTNKDYAFGTNIPIIHSSYLIGSVFEYYIVKNFNHYDDYWYLYWTSLLIFVLAFNIIFMFINKRKIKNNDKPKIRVNK
ncbi:MAG: hypothetical protein ACI35S_08460 [Anaeroplasma sp.]